MVVIRSDVPLRVDRPQTADGVVLVRVGPAEGCGVLLELNDQVARRLALDLLHRLDR
jgi:hypothetical protein